MSGLLQQLETSLGRVAYRHYCNYVRQASAELTGQRPGLGWIDGGEWESLTPENRYAWRAAAGAVAEAWERLREELVLQERS